jgi:hypothetical protein
MEITANMINSLKAVLIIGVSARYNHSNDDVDMIAIGELYKKIADKAMRETGIYVSASVTPCKVLYKTKWGCPKGGENSVRFEADCNPIYSDTSISFSEYIDAWQVSVMYIVKELMIALDQNTVTMSFLENEVIYIEQLAISHLPN